MTCNGLSIVMYHLWLTLAVSACLVAPIITVYLQLCFYGLVGLLLLLERRHNDLVPFKGVDWIMSWTCVRLAVIGWVESVYMQSTLSYIAFHIIIHTT